MEPHEPTNENHSNSDLIQKGKEKTSETEGTPSIKQDQKEKRKKPGGESSSNIGSSYQSSNTKSKPNRTIPRTYPKQHNHQNMNFAEMQNILIDAHLRRIVLTKVKYTEIEKNAYQAWKTIITPSKIRNLPCYHTIYSAIHTKPDDAKRCAIKATLEYLSRTNN